MNEHIGILIAQIDDDAEAITNNSRKLHTIIENQYDGLVKAMKDALIYGYQVKAERRELPPDVAEWLKDILKGVE